MGVSPKAFPWGLATKWHGWCLGVIGMAMCICHISMTLKPCFYWLSEIGNFKIVTVSVLPL